ncbi:sigma-70 family RNA polymerase sigma factor [Bacillus sp. IITD106]|nr:sigma-70 family RNA polymerase sigma factor [Bacillus sp. IITD106]
MVTNRCNESSMTELNNSYYTIADKELWLNEIMDTYGDDVIWLAYSYVRDRAIAEDLAQNTFIKCYQHADSFRGDSSLKTWIYRIAINCCKDYLRSSYFKRMLPTNLIHHFIHESFASPESIYMKKDTSNALIEHVFSLAPKYREVVMLYYFENLKIQEIEDILNIKVNTIKTRLRKARAILKENIEKGGYPFD